MSRQKKKAKARNGEGNIRQLASGRHQVRFSSNGASHTQTFPTRDAAEAYLLQLRADAQRGTLVAPSHVTFAEYAREWQEARKAGLALSTYLGRKRLLERHIIPVIGHMRVQDIKPETIEALMTNLRQHDERTPRRDGQPLSRSVRKQIVGVLRMIFGKLYRQRIIALDPAAMAEITHPRDRGPQRRKAWTAEEAARFYTVAREHHIGAVFCFMLSTGLRVGEALGLRLPNVNLETGQVDIRESLMAINGHRHVTTPKTVNAERTLAVTGDALKILREHVSRKAWQRQANPSTYVDTDYVFTNSRGNSCLPDTVYRVMQNLCREAEVPYLGTHVLRHTYISLQAMRGTPIEVLSKQAGHSVPSFTMNTYRSVYVSERRDLTLQFTPPGSDKKEDIEE